jgi:hypothetical protein
MISHRRSIPMPAAILVLTLSLAAPLAPARAADAPKAAPSPQAAPAATPAPFAKVYLALRGCTSCAHCRATIRRMAKGSASGGEAVVHDDQVEVRYAKPRAVPLRDVIRGLAQNRLHDLELVDVLFEATGTIANDARGGLRFTLAETGQSFAVRVPDSLSRPPGGRPVRLTAVVDGWRESGALTLVARELRAGA